MPYAVAAWTTWLWTKLPFDAGFRGVKLVIVKQSNEWAVQRDRYTTLEIITSMTDDPAASLPAS